MYFLSLQFDKWPVLIYTAHLPLYLALKGLFPFLFYGTVKYGNKNIADFNYLWKVLIYPR